MLLQNDPRHFACLFKEGMNGTRGGLPSKPGLRFLLLSLSVVLNLSNLEAQIPLLNSYPAGTATIYLDFDGQYVTGTSWNWNGPIDAMPSNLSTAAISEIFSRVAEDYRPFNLNITTDSLVYFRAPFDKRIRLIITPSSSWYGNAGGISYVGSFNWGDETPAWVFSNLLGNNNKYIAEACSHEAGHTLGLQHQSTYDSSCAKIAEYSEGQGNGEIGWAPIMGLGYYKNLTTWHTGTNTVNCSTIQNDIAIISGTANSFGFRADDHGNSTSTATDIKLQGQNFTLNGLINGTQDVDAFRLNLNISTRIWIAAIPQNVGTGNAGADVDLKIALLNSTKDTIGVYNPSTLLDVFIDTTLNSGVYYLMVSATGNVNHSVYGNMGLYWLSGSVTTLLALNHFILKVSRKDEENLLSWSYLGDEPVKKIIVETSQDGKVFHPLISLDGEATKFIYRPLDQAAYYRVLAVSGKDERIYYSNVGYLSKDLKEKSVEILSRLVHTSVKIVSGRNYTYQIIGTSGQLLYKGNLITGANEVDISHAPSGILLMRIGDNVVRWTEKLIKQ